MNRNDMAGWFEDLVSLDTAAKIMKVDPSAIRHAIARGTQGLREGYEYAKFGKQWILHKSAIIMMSGKDTWDRYALEQWNAWTKDHKPDKGPDNVAHQPKTGNQKFKIPKKYEQAVKEVYEDEDGIWCILNPGWTHVDDAHTIHCETYKELRSELTAIKKVTIP